MNVVKQRRKGDCGVAALATYLGQTYEDAYAAVSGSMGKGGCPTGGLWVRELERAALRMGVSLVRRRRPDLDEDAGILSVVWDRKARKAYRGHYVVLRDGRVFDVDAEGSTEGVPAGDWLAREHGRAGHLLTMGRQ